MDPFLMAIVCLVSGYRGGYSISLQYDTPEGKLRKITMPKKWKKIFKMSYGYGDKCLLVSLILEIAALIVAGVEIIWGVIYITFPLFQKYFMVTIIIFMLYAAFILGVAIIVHIKYHTNIKKTYGSNKRCWSCEVEKLCWRPIVFRKVKVISLVKDNKDGVRYCILYGKWFPRIFEAISVENNEPIVGEYTRAMYTDDNPHFLLIDKWG